MSKRSFKPCPIFGCKKTIPHNHTLCREHFKMIPRPTQCEFFAIQKKFEEGEATIGEFVAITKKATEEVAEIVASRRSNNLLAIEKLQAALSI